MSQEIDIRVAGPAEGLAALAAAVARRTGNERVALRCALDDTSGPVTFAVASPDGFAALCEQAAKGLAELRADVPCQPSAEVATSMAVVIVPAGSSAPETGPDHELTAIIEATHDGDAGLTVRGGSSNVVWSAEELRMFRHLVVAVLDAARRDDRVPVATLDLSAAAEPPVFWGGTMAPAADRRLEELIAERVAERPDSVAVSASGRTLTYRQLNDRAGDLAAVLARHTPPEQVVALLMRRSPERIVAILAILRAGCAYLSLNEDDPQGRLDSLVADAGARVTVLDTDLAARAPAGTTAVVATSAGLAGQSVIPADAGSSGADGLAYVCYTSGSSGEPKGVGVPHRAVSRLVRLPGWLHIEPEDVFLQISPLSFDAATLEVFAPLANGCRLAVMPPGKLEMPQIADVIRREGVTVLLLTTGLLHRMIVAELPAFAGVRHVLTGGEVASAALVERLFEAHPGLTFTNGYGPTENTTFTTCWTATEPAAGPTVPIGDPISGTSIAILDGELRPVPGGAAGQLYTAGEGLARSYLGRPGATAERFLPHPWPGVPGERIYRTGDMVRRRGDGTVEFIGRTDLQVKIQGFRVELGEIEDALLRCPEVADAAVTAQTAGSGGSRLIAYVVPAAGHDSAELGPRLRERLRGVLPAYMVPWAVVITSELRLNHHGKVDRQALPAVTRQPRNVRNDYIAPVGVLERRLAEIWGLILSVEPIGVHDDFFDLGGHSLLAAELLEAVSREFRTDVPARTLYLQPTIHELAMAFPAEHSDPATIRTTSIDED